MNINQHLIIIFFITLLFCPITEILAQTVKRGPYLQQSTPNSIIIRWRTDVSTSSKVWYGTNPNNLGQTATSGGDTKEHSVKISGLNPATKYYYRIGDDNNQYPALSTGQYFKTHPEGNTSNQTIRAWMLGNAGTGDAEQLDVRDAYYSVVGDEHIDMILFTGDNAYDDGKDSEYQELVFDVYEARMANSVSWSCFGNHDAGDADSGNESGTYYEIFDFPKNAEAGGLPTGTEAYFSFDYGNMHVVSLNTVDVDIDPGSDMLQWLEDDLAATDKTWKVVLLHHRPYTGSNNNDSDDDPKPRRVRENALPVLEAGGVDLVLSSHSHSYQRSYLINGHYGKSNTFNPSTMGIDMGDGQADGDGAYNKINSDIGTVYVVAGTAGQDDTGADELNHPVMHYNSGSPGSVQLLVSESELLFQFINEDEEVEDYFTIEKSPSDVNLGFRISNPLTGAVFPAPHNITITTELSDENIPLIDQVSFYINNNYIGSDQSFPYYQSWLIPAFGEYEIKAIAQDAAGNTLFESVVSISAGMQELCIPINTGSDDAEEDLSGNMSTGSGDLELVDDGGIQQVGLRFTNVGIPQGTTIGEAYIQFTADEDWNINPCALQIHGEKTANSSSFTNSNFNISSRQKTNAVVNWSPAQWNTIGESAAAQRSPNIASLISEITNQPGYGINSALTFIISGTGKRVADSYEGGASKAAMLCINYVPDPCPDADNDGICDENDPCPSGPEYGLACDDNNPATYNDLIDENCNCVGTPGNCPNLQLPIGATCNDNNPATYNDLVTEDCNCEGTLFDCPALLLNIGAPCNDNNNATYNDVVTNNCDCAGTPFDCPTYLANVGSPCDDGNPNTSNDILDANCNCVGSIYDCPVLELNFGDPCDDNNPLTINDQVSSACECAGTLLQAETVVVTVAASSDDAEEGENGGLSLTSSDLELVEDGETQVVGVRFVATGIPAMVTITNAYIQFTTDETGASDPVIITITGHDTNNAATFEKTDHNISSRPRTSASASWQPALWTAVGSSGQAQRTTDLSAIVQELVNRPGFANGGPLAFIFEGQGKRVAESYDGGGSQAGPRLVVSYVFSCEDDDNDGVCNPQDICNGAEPGTPCNDNNSTTYGDVIDANCNCTGTAFDCPTQLANIGTPCDDGNPLTINDAIDANCNCTGLPPGTAQTICSQVSSGADDAEEEVDGNVNNNSSDLEMVIDDGDQLVGIRFANLGIPQGAVIETATIQFMVDETGNINPCQLSIFAEATDHAAAFAESDFNISSRSKTTASATWSPAAWTSKGASGPDQMTVNLAAVLQEVISRPGYAEGNAVAFLINGTGKRVAEAYEGDVAGAPELCVTYSMSAPTAGIMAPSGNSFATMNARLEDADAAAVKGGSNLIHVVESLKVYPNPSKGDLYLSFYNEGLTETQVQIQHVNGQSLRSEVFGLEQGVNVLSLLDLNLANGVYVVRMWNGKAWESEKFVILR